MPYLTHTELAESIGADRLNSIADFDGDGSYDEPPVTEALSRASDIIDTYVNAYLPLSSPYPGVITDACAVIATWMIRGDRDIITEDAQARYDSVMRWLRDVATGKATIPGVTDEGGEEPGTPVFVSEDRLWTRDTARGVF